MARVSKGWDVGSRCDGSVQEYPTVREFCRPSNKPGITINHARRRVYIYYYRRLFLLT